MIVRDGNIVIERPQDGPATPVCSPRPGGRRRVARRIGVYPPRRDLGKSLSGESRFKQLAKARLLSGKEIRAPMALSDGKLVIRGQSEMKCFNVATK